MPSNEEMILQTKKWVTDVVIGANFCPFAAKEVRNNTLHYEVVSSNQMSDCLAALLNEFVRLDEHPEIETTLLIIPNGFPEFLDYLDLVDEAEKLLENNDYEGIYQLASFHPEYCFAGSDENDAANYTNRSIYPMLHLLRESSIEEAIDKYPNTDDIPERNVQFAQKKGLAYMKLLRQQCLGI